jgi:hypothetical protein
MARLAIDWGTVPGMRARPPSMRRAPSVVLARVISRAPWCVALAYTLLMACSDADSGPPLTVTQCASAGLAFSRITSAYIAYHQSLMVLRDRMTTVKGSGTIAVVSIPASTASTLVPKPTFADKGLEPLTVVMRRIADLNEDTGAISSTIDAGRLLSAPNASWVQASNGVDNLVAVFRDTQHPAGDWWKAVFSNDVDRIERDFAASSSAFNHAASSRCRFPTSPSPGR